jgi:hypothetical protein
VYLFQSLTLQIEDKVKEQFWPNKFVWSGNLCAIFFLIYILAEQSETHNNSGLPQMGEGDKEENKNGHFQIEQNILALFRAANKNIRLLCFEK